MYESVPDLDEVVPCGPMFVETEDGFALTAEAQAIVDAMAAAERVEPPSVTDRLEQLRRQASALAAELPSATRGLDDHAVLDAVRTLQSVVNTLGACDQALVAEIERRPETVERTGARSTAAWLTDALRIRRGEANRRVATANGCSARTTLTGESLPPVRALVAEAQAVGTISTDHAHTIDRALHALPVGLPVEVVVAAERALVDLATHHDPADVATLGRGLREVLDPDGAEPRDEQQHRLRALRLVQRDDGSGRIVGELTAGLFAKVQAVLSPLAAPRPSDANGDDTRSPEHRLHDALEDACDRLLRSGTLPDSGGTPTSVVVTISLDQLERRTGRAHTSHGGDLSVAALLHLANEAAIIPVVLDDAGGVLSHGQTKRLATAGQTTALIARDRHCSFPGCRIPPEWCQRHHVIAWSVGGITAVDNLTLLCGHHHRNFARWGWRCEMRDGRPWWVPPPDLDPTARPLLNATV